MPRTEQLALLLNLIGEDAARTAMGSLDHQTAKELNRVLADLKSDPPTDAEVNEMLQDFERFFSFALEQIQSGTDAGGNPVKAAGKQDQQGPGVTEESFAVEWENVRAFTKPNFTGDVKLDLNLLHPYQVAYAIRNENPSAIAVVIDNLAEAHAAKTLELLPPDVRLDVFLQLAQPSTVSPKVKGQILEAALKSAGKVEQRVPEEDRTKQMITLVRSLPRQIRTPMMEKLMEQNETLAKSVKAEMYRFEDLLRLGDRDLQRLLSQTDSDALVVSLAHADAGVRQKILKNVSKRARQTIEEEMEFKANARIEEIEMAERQIVEVIVRMDEEGEISFE